MPLLEQVLEKYPETVKILFKNFPLRNHKFARDAAVSAMSANKQGKFWEYHDAVFDSYNALSDEKLMAIAEEVGLDMVLFEEGKRDIDVLSVIDRDLKEAGEAGVRGTPTIFVNGRLLRNRSLEGFQVMIVSELGRVEQQR